MTQPINDSEREPPLDPTPGRETEFERATSTAVAIAEAVAEAEATVVVTRTLARRQRTLLLSIVPLYFVSRALQPMMADSIRHEGQEYFAFVMVGLMASGCITTAVNAVPMTTPTARSTTLPRMMKSLKPWNIFFTGTPGGRLFSPATGCPSPVDDKLRRPECQSRAGSSAATASSTVG